MEVTLDLIDGKWKGVILYHLQGGRLRFGELRKRMPGITQRMLTKQLRALEGDDLITRRCLLKFRRAWSMRCRRPACDFGR